MKRERRFLLVEDTEIEVRADGSAPTIEGYFARFGKWVSISGMFMERVKKGAFTDTIKDPDDDVRGLFNHDPNLVLARQSNDTLELSEDNKGGFMRATPPGTQTANDVVTLIDDRYVTGQSFGFAALEDVWETKEIDGEPIEHRTIVKARLYDVGPVTFPAYQMTDVNTRSAEEVYEARMADLKDEPGVAEAEPEVVEDEAQRGIAAANARQRDLELSKSKWKDTDRTVK